jgi:hypothetical protein
MSVQSAMSDRTVVVWTRRCRNGEALQLDRELRLDRNCRCIGKCSWVRNAGGQGSAAGDEIQLDREVLLGTN